MKKEMEIMSQLLKNVTSVMGDTYVVEPELKRENNGIYTHVFCIKEKDGIATLKLPVDNIIEVICNGYLKMEDAVQHISDECKELYRNKRYYQYDDGVHDFGLGIVSPDSNREAFARGEFDPLSQSIVLGAGCKSTAFFNKDYILSHVEYALINAERNKDLLQTIPFKEFENLEDLVAIYKIVINDNDRIASCTVTNNMLEMVGIVQFELDEMAIKNTYEAGFEIKNIDTVIVEMIGVSVEDLFEDGQGPTQMYVISNKRKLNGAAALLFNDVLSEVAEKFDDDLGIIPSSVHEVLAVPLSLLDYAYISGLIESVNSNGIDPEDVLSDSVYKYDRKLNKVTRMDM